MSFLGRCRAAFSHPSRAVLAHTRPPTSSRNPRQSMSSNSNPNPDEIRISSFPSTTLATPNGHAPASVTSPLTEHTISTNPDPIAQVGKHKTSTSPELRVPSNLSPVEQPGKHESTVTGFSPEHTRGPTTRRMQAEKHKTTATKRPAKSTTRKRLAAGPTVRVERPKATATSSPAKHKYIPVKHYRNERDEAPQKPAAAPFIYHPTASENVNVLLPSKYKHNIPKDLIWQMGNCHTAHVTNLKGLFSTYTEYPRGQKIIRVRSGAQKLPNLKVLGYGEIKLRFPGIDGKTREITIQALYSSMAPYNMLSPKLLSLDMILDNKGGWALKDKEGVVAVGPMRSQLPFLRTYGRGENGEDIGMKEEDIRATASDGRIPDGLMMPHTGGICRLEGGAIVTNIYDYTRAIEVYESQRTRDEAVFNIILPRILMGESAPGVLNL